MREYEKLLRMSNYDPVKSRKLIDGFTNGFSIGYCGKRNVRQTAPNLKLFVGSKIELWNKVMKEVKLKRFAGPYESIPFDNFIQSPIGLVPKAGGKTRLIFHLSYPRNRKNLSVNANTPPELSKVQYTNFDQAIALCLQCGNSCKLAKSDMESAFRNLGIKKSHWHLLILKAEDPENGKVFYFVDECLPFGASISCAHFQSFSDSIAHIVTYFTRKPLVNYLDDFFFAALTKLLCDLQVEKFLEVCRQINFPVSMEKTFWGSTTIIFLGLLIDTVAGIVAVQQEKILKAKQLIRQALSKKSHKITVHQLQKITGFLNFLGRAVIPGRAFTRRLYLSNPNLKQHHHVKISAEMKLDLEMWLTFLNHPSVFSRSFMDFSKCWNAHEVNFYTDASKV